MLPGPAVAQAMPGEVSRQQLDRQQYQDELLLRQRQFEQGLDPSLSGPRRLELERRQLEQQQRQSELHSGQQQRLIQREATLPNLPENQQSSERLRGNAEFSREGQQLLDELQFDP
jgi:hypothetical protein